MILVTHINIYLYHVSECFHMSTSYAFHSCIRICSIHSVTSGPKSRRTSCCFVFPTTWMEFILETYCMTYILLGTLPWGNRIVRHYPTMFALMLIIWHFSVALRLRKFNAGRNVFHMREMLREIHIFVCMPQNVHLEVILCSECLFLIIILIVTWVLKTRILVAIHVVLCSSSYRLFTKIPSPQKLSE